MRCHHRCSLARAQGQEFWSAAGFVGTFANDYHSDLDDSDSEVEGDEHAAPTGVHDDGEWNDDDPVLEICEPIDGGEAGVLKHWHASQRAFEESEGRVLSQPPP